MADRYSVAANTLTGIASAIRTKLNSQETMTVSEMAGNIAMIQGGSSGTVLSAPIAYTKTAKTRWTSSTETAANSNNFAASAIDVTNDDFVVLVGFLRINYSFLDGSMISVLGAPFTQEFESHAEYPLLLDCRGKKKLRLTGVTDKPLEVRRIVSGGYVYL